MSPSFESCMSTSVDHYEFFFSVISDVSLKFVTSTLEAFFSLNCQVIWVETLNPRRCFPESHIFFSRPVLPQNSPDSECDKAKSYRSYHSQQGLHCSSVLDKTSRCFLGPRSLLSIRYTLEVAFEETLSLGYIKKVLQQS